MILPRPSSVTSSGTCVAPAPALAFAPKTDASTLGGISAIHRNSVSFGYTCSCRSSRICTAPDPGRGGDADEGDDDDDDVDDDVDDDDDDGEDAEADAGLQPPASVTLPLPLPAPVPLPAPQ